MGGKLHLTKIGKDGSIYEKTEEEFSLQGFRQDKKHAVSKIKPYTEMCTLRVYKWLD